MRREAEDCAASDGDDVGTSASHSPAPEVEIVPLLNALPALVREVQKLNLGVLPVQPPPLCYKRAVKSELCFAAILQDDDDQEPPPKRVRREDESAPHVIGAVLAEHDLIHRLVHIQTLAVDARHRRLGVGRQLIERIVASAASLERVTCIQLHVHEANDDACAFYGRLGFEEHKRLENYYRHLTPRTAIVLRKSIS